MTTVNTFKCRHTNPGHQDVPCPTKQCAHAVQSWLYVPDCTAHGAQDQRCRIRMQPQDALNIKLFPVFVKNASLLELCNGLQLPQCTWGSGLAMTLPDATIGVVALVCSSRGSCPPSADPGASPPEYMTSRISFAIDTAIGEAADEIER